MEAGLISRSNIGHQDSTRPVRNNYLRVAVLIVFFITFTGVLLNYSHAARAQNDSNYFNHNSEWPLIGGNLTNTRYSALSQITSNNINRLGGAWSSKQFDNGATSRATPVVVDGLMFISAGAALYAFDAKHGEIVWIKRTEAHSSEEFGILELQSSGYGVPGYQGVATGEGKVFAGLMDGRVIALEQKTGRLIWSRQIGDDPPPKKEGQNVSGAPTYIDGIVFAGISADYGHRGRVVALNAKTGKELWRFYTIPAPGEQGSETWPQKGDLWKWAGGGVWQTGAIDPDLGMIYFAVGNPTPQMAGDNREGDNLFTDSVIALDIKTGKLQWYYQLVHHDIWDADLGTALVLYEIQIDGQQRKGLAAMRADGYLLFFDRKTGEPLLPVEERQVPQSTVQKTSPTQPFPVEGESILPACRDWEDKVPAGYILGCSFTPGSADIHNLVTPWFPVRVSPMSYNPQTGYFYSQARVGLSRLRRTADPYFFFFPRDYPPGVKPFGILAASDSRTGQIVWKKEMPSNVLGRGGMLSTAGGLIFRLQGDGNFVAMNSKSGNVLWQFQTGFTGGSGSPISYAIDGDQYIAVSAGPLVRSFKLGGELDPSPAPTLPSSIDDIFSGPISNTNQIETASLVRDIGTTGQRYFTDEYAFQPQRAQITTGSRVTWINNGVEIHTISAQDGSWTTGPIHPGAMGVLTISSPGRHTYICRDHPWSYGQLIVRNPEDESLLDSKSGFYTIAQADRGKDQYTLSCSNCHGDDLSGKEPATPLAGESFLLKWNGRSVGDLFNLIRSTMPQENPGHLDQGVYLDIVAYLLQANGYPQGMKELINNSAILQDMILTR
jgi:PQQ-dependent dehydrogenase (methanol/ethanol family)